MSSAKLLPGEVLAVDELIADGRKVLGCGGCAPVSGGVFGSADVVEVVNRIGVVLQDFCGLGSSVTGGSGGKCAVVAEKVIAFTDSEYTIPQGIEIIGDNAFSFCDNLTSVTIPDSVTSIGTSAFSWCDNLTEITVGRDSYARQYCIDNDLPYTYADANDWLNG